MIIVGRYINGISLNGLEFLLNNNENYKTFKNEREAKRFLKSEGYTNEDIEWLTFQEYNGEKFFFPKKEIKK